MTAHIQINDVKPLIHYDLLSPQSAFTFPFAIFKESDIEVWLGDTLVTSGFTVSGAGDTNGGTVAFAAPVAAGVLVTLRRRVKLERTSDHQADGIIRAKVLNDELDYQVAALQQVAEEFDRVPRLSPTSRSDADLTLPEPQGGAMLAWRDDGKGLTNKTVMVDAAAGMIFGTTGRDLAAAVTVADVQHLLGLGSAAQHDALAFAASDGEGRLAVSALPEGLDSRLAFLEHNLALNTLRDQIDAGWSVLKMVDGVADEFEDQTGIASLGGATYDTVGDYLHNCRIGTNAIPAQSGFSGNLTYTSTGGAGQETWRMFDRSQSTYMSVSLTNPWFVAWDFGTPTPLGAYSIAVPDNASAMGGHNPKSWTFEGWDGTTWVVLDTRSLVPSWADSEKRTYTLAATANYGKYKISVTAGFSSSLQLTEIEFISAPAPDNIIVVSVPFTTQDTPAEARVVVLHQPIGAVAANIDLVVDVSRDSGANWAAVGLTNQGLFDATTTILAGTADLSGQAPGTAIQWRVRTFNGKEQRLHGIWMQWR